MGGVEQWGVVVSYRFPTPASRQPWTAFRWLVLTVSII